MTASKLETLRELLMALYSRSAAEDRDRGPGKEGRGGGGNKGTAVHVRVSTRSVAAWYGFVVERGSNRGAETMCVAGHYWCAANPGSAAGKHYW